MYAVTYSQHDWDFDCAPAPQKDLVSDESRAQYILLPSDMKKWYVIRLDIMSDGIWFEAGKFVLRPGFAILALDRPVKYDTTVILTHRREPALGSVFMMSDDRRTMEEFLDEWEDKRKRSNAESSRMSTSDDVSCEEMTVSSSVTGGSSSYKEEITRMQVPRDADWSSSDSEVETKRKCVPKREYNHKILPKARGPSLRAKLPGMRNSPALRSYSRISMENQRLPNDNQRIHFNVAMNFPKMIMTFDKQSQTENTGDEDIYALSGTTTVLQGEVSRLTQMLTEMQEKMECMINALGLQCDPFDSNYSVKEEVVVSETNQRGNPILMDNNMAMSDAPVVKTPARRNVLLEVNRGSHGQNKRISPQFKREPSRENTSNSYGSDDAVYLDMVPIGSGKTFIPKEIYSHINWNSYTIATRKLLMAVFPRRTLATHCLTGKASPAFLSKPAKLRLDTKKVSDIVLTVVENCGVRESLVRSCITTKCADENKMYRIRLQNKANKSKKNTEDPAVNQENTPPGRNYEADV